MKKREPHYLFNRLDLALKEVRRAEGLHAKIRAKNVYYEILESMKA